jgi:hypothetical protein
MRGLSSEHEDFLGFCRSVFASLPRTDQRKCAEVYVTGLIRGTSRRSTRQMAAELPGSRSSQSLQQFVNQSPWDPMPVRCRIAEQMTAGAAPTAWVVDEVFFPKSGRCSPAVERQYVPSLGRTVNGQLGAVLAVTGPDRAAPINWRLCLPASWDADRQRRERGRVPHDERHLPFWEYVIQLVDDASVDWGIAPAPVVADLSQRPGVDECLDALEARGLEYLVQVSASYAMPHPLAGRRPPGVATSEQRRPAGPVARVEDIVVALPLPRRTPVTWLQGPEGRALRSQFLSLPVGTAGPGLRAGGPRRLLVDWPLCKPRPQRFWLTNLLEEPTERLVELATSRWRVRQCLSELDDQYGLSHYEGRSFPGWHHHVTLVAAAFAFHNRSRAGVSVPLADAVRALPA